jgi:hypothetical protein
MTKSMITITNDRPRSPRAGALLRIRAGIRAGQTSEEILRELARDCPPLKNSEPQAGGSIRA